MALILNVEFELGGTTKVYQTKMSRPNLIKSAEVAMCISIVKNEFSRIPLEDRKVMAFNRNEQRKKYYSDETDSYEASFNITRTAITSSCTNWDGPQYESISKHAHNAARRMLEVIN